MAENYDQIVDELETEAGRYIGPSRNNNLQKIFANPYTPYLSVVVVYLVLFIMYQPNIVRQEYRTKHGVYKSCLSFSKLIMWTLICSGITIGGTILLINEYKRRKN